MGKKHSSKSVARSALETRALLAARSLVDRMRTLYRELEQMTGAPIGLHRALVCIGNDPGLPASKLAELLGMRRPAVSQVLKSLTQRGWIKRSRSERDQRTVQIFPTQEGRQVLQATAGRAVFTLQSAVCSLPEQQLEQLIQSVEQLLTQLPDHSPVSASVRRTARRRGRHD
jgi:DNA-binding MarR family transcriptional regulator